MSNLSSLVLAYQDDTERYGGGFGAYGAPPEDIHRGGVVGGLDLVGQPETVYSFDRAMEIFTTLEPETGGLRQTEAVPGPESSPRHGKDVLPIKKPPADATASLGRLLGRNTRDSAEKADAGAAADGPADADADADAEITLAELLQGSAAKRDVYPAFGDEDPDAEGAAVSEPPEVEKLETVGDLRSYRAETQVVDY